MRKLAVLLPGIGYSLDRSLLYFTRRIAADQGYEIRPVPYAGFPTQVRGDREKMLLCYRIAREQTMETLAGLDLYDYDEYLFVGKSIGTVIAAELACQVPENRRARQILFTPLEDTFSFPIRDALVFTGGEDPWVGGRSSPIPALCAQGNLPCHVIPGANHSLETDSVQADLENQRQILEEAARYIRGIGREAL